MKDVIELDILKSSFEYDPESGSFTKIKKYNWKKELIDCEPKLVNCVNAYGYYQVNFKRKVYLVHRLIVYIMKGVYPDKDVDIDHINGIRTDNRWSNIRLVDRSENLRNVGMRSDNSSGVKGVHLEKSSGKYFTFIYHNKKRIVLGRFDTLDEAKKVRDEAMIKYGYHENHGSRDGWKPKQNA